MIKTSIQKYLNQLLSKRLGKKIPTVEISSVGGGSINGTFRVRAGSENFFLKVNSSSRFPGLFEKEKSGLEFIASKKCIRVPIVVACDQVDQDQILLLEWIEGGARNDAFWKRFGSQLAELHQVTTAECGFSEDNYMGALPQKNSLMRSWTEFFVRCRLEPQLQSALANHLVESRHLDAFEKLYPRLENIFGREGFALLHGDLWSGNFVCDQFSTPVLIDPAVYFGHRSMDLGMTTLFGGFDRMFYESYNYHFPFPENYDEQWEICNLYPLLIHLNLFGPGYLGQIDRILKKFTP